ncbi:MAG TPA: hypothetical protein VFZ25_08490 [Chloroflexota bacterium]|nr:hypothetical protein [Chloroflexota bacterium]
MGLLDGLLKRVGIGGGPKETGDRGVYYYIRCNKCKEKIRVRVDPYWDLSPEFEGSGFSVTKHVIGQKCFRTIEVSLTFDDKRQETERSISGGTFITVAEYEEGAEEARTSEEGKA